MDDSNLACTPAVKKLRDAVLDACETAKEWLKYPASLMDAEALANVDEAIGLLKEWKEKTP